MYSLVITNLRAVHYSYDEDNNEVILKEVPFTEDDVWVWFGGTKRHGERADEGIVEAIRDEHDLYADEDEDDPSVDNYWCVEYDTHIQAVLDERTDGAYREFEPGGEFA